MFVLVRDGVRLDCSSQELDEACRLAIRGRADLFENDRQVDCLAVLGLDRSGLFAAPRIGQLRPTRDEVRAMFRILDMSGAAIARLTGTTSRKVRAWAGDEENASWAAWHVMAVYVGLSAPMLGDYPMS
ncbi:hypothetical protein LIS66_27315 (plasmid) [Pseudomonas sp. HN2]|uniref:hypothetical protein n=1 Tax=Pseudomonas sp. HN2 TaxID=2884805 RepID=UPI001D14D62E|nr:hypothetical protein [Pseudomonas sp. HN2]UEB98686.1 hypothetical protein LIS66_27610 [Pseudomonas sp. HN2]UEB98742.1 hypothetical protein LIS66_27315 [Pseudomonas sp. HN2]